MILRSIVPRRTWGLAVAAVAAGLVGGACAAALSGMNSAIRATTGPTFDCIRRVCHAATFPRVTRPLLVALLLVELRLEVVEQQVPAHARTLLRHASPLARSPQVPESLDTTRAGQYRSVKDHPTSPDRG